MTPVDTKLRQRAKSGFNAGWLAWAVTVACIALLIYFGIGEFVYHAARPWQDQPRFYDLTDGGTSSPWLQLREDRHGELFVELYRMVFGQRAVEDNALLFALLRITGPIVWVLWSIRLSSPLYNIIARRYKIAAQSRRDEGGQASVHRALFLRPFFSDRKLKFYNPFFREWLPEPRSLLSQEFIGRILEPYIDVVQFGGSHKEVANARVAVPRGEPDWWPLFEHQVAQASAIIVVPLQRKSGTRSIEGMATILEMKYLLASRALERAIVVMPPMRGHGWLDMWLEDSWELARAKMSELRLELPRYSLYGDVMVFECVVGDWKMAASFCEGREDEHRLAFGVVEAMKWLARRHRFELLDR
jgi:hypothetical protein